MKHRTGENTQGFSYLELILVIGMIGILAAIAAPRVGQTSTHYRIDRAAWHLANDIAYAQSIARQSSQIQTVIFDIEEELITLPGIERLDHHQGDYRYKLADSLYGVDLVQVDFVNNAHVTSPDTLAFDMWGMPMCGQPEEGHPYTALSSGAIVLELGTESRTLTITPITGKVTIE